MDKRDLRFPLPSRAPLFDRGLQPAPTRDLGRTPSPGSAHLREEAFRPLRGFTNLFQTTLQGPTTPDPWGHGCISIHKASCTGKGPGNRTTKRLLTPPRHHRQRCRANMFRHDCSAPRQGCWGIWQLCLAPRKVAGESGYYAWGSAQAAGQSSKVACRSGKHAREPATLPGTHAQLQPMAARDLHCAGTAGPV